MKTGIMDEMDLAEPAQLKKEAALFRAWWSAYCSMRDQVMNERTTELAWQAWCAGRGLNTRVS